MKSVYAPLDHPDPERGQCRATVYYCDTYRRTGGTRSGFELHYTRAQCTRRARESGYCWQHEPRELEVTR